MELWKIKQWCETSDLEAIHQKERQLLTMIAEGKLSRTNAAYILEVLREYIELKQLFEKR